MSSITSQKFPPNSVHPKGPRKKVEKNIYTLDLAIFSRIIVFLQITDVVVVSISSKLFRKMLFKYQIDLLNFRKSFRVEEFDRVLINWGVRGIRLNIEGPGCAILNVQGLNVLLQLHLIRRSTVTTSFKSLFRRLGFSAAENLRMLDLSNCCGIRLKYS